MRVCMLAYTFYEGDNRVMRYAEALAEQGSDVEVIALRQPGQDSIQMMHGVRVFRIQTRIKDERNPLSYLLRMIGFILRSMLFLAMKHLRSPYQLIHVHSMPDFLVFAAWLPKLLGAKIILDIHDLSPELYATKFSGKRTSRVFYILSAAERLSARFAHHVIVPNHLWLEKVTARSVQADRCSVFMNLPDASVFTKEIGPRELHDRIQILYPGSLQWHQGLDLAIYAMAHLVATGKEAELHIYGEGQAKLSLVRLTEELGLQGVVFFYGNVPLRQVAKIMQTADLGIIPKRNDSFGDEAFSTKSLEFMAVGVPVIVSSTRIDRFYFNEDVVTFFTPGSSRELAERLEELIENPDRRSYQAHMAEQFVHNAFCWEDKRMDYLSLVEMLVSPQARVFSQISQVERYQGISRR